MDIAALAAKAKFPEEIPFSQLRDGPPAVFDLVLGTGWPPSHLRNAVDTFFFLYLMELYPEKLVGVQFRGLSLDRLDCILETGIDVVPSDAVIYTSTAEKALEYGGDGPRCLVVLRNDRIRPTHKIITADAPAEEIERLRARYPTEVPMPDKGKIYFSRLSRDDRRLGTGYEHEYASWIPGDAKDALVAVVLVGPDTDALQSELAAAESRIRAVT